MKIYYVVPPKGKNYRSQADAQAAFEMGEVWRCTGHATVEDGKVTSATRYREFAPARYTQGDRVKIDDESIVYIPHTWALQWAPGRVSLLRYSVRHTQRKVSYHYGRGKGVDLIKKRETNSNERYQSKRVVAKQRHALLHELNNQGGWLTSGGLRFRPTFPDEALHLDPFPMVRWYPSGMTGFPLFDANPACRTLGDRELERWYTSAQHRAYNSFAADRAALGEPDSDDQLDPMVRYFPQLV